MEVLLLGAIALLSLEQYKNQPLSCHVFQQKSTSYVREGKAKMTLIRISGLEDIGFKVVSVG